jgi:hypothetical protein
MTTKVAYSVHVDLVQFRSGKLLSKDSHFILSVTEEFFFFGFFKMLDRM